MTAAQNLKFEEAETRSSDPSIPFNPPEKEAADHNPLDESTHSRLNGDSSFVDVHLAVVNDNGLLLDDAGLEAEVMKFIDEYQAKQLCELDSPAVVLSKLRRLYKVYSAKINRSEAINSGIATKYGIRNGMLLNIEKNLLRVEGKQWISHYTETYGQKSLRTAQDYMALGKIPNIINYAVLGKERLMGALRAIKALDINSDDPMNALFQKCEVPFNPDGSPVDEAMTDMKRAIDKTVAISKMKKAEEKNGVQLEVNFDLINRLIDEGVCITGQFINDLFKIKSEGKDVNSHLESLCNGTGNGDELLPHIKKTEALPKLVEGLKDTVESIRQHGALLSRLKRENINELETCVAELKNLFENRSAA